MPKAYNKSKDICNHIQRLKLFIAKVIDRFSDLFFKSNTWFGDLKYLVLILFQP